MGRKAKGSKALLRVMTAWQPKQVIFTGIKLRLIERNTCCRLFLKKEITRPTKATLPKDRDAKQRDLKLFRSHDSLAAETSIKVSNLSVPLKGGTFLSKKKENGFKAYLSVWQ